MWQIEGSKARLDTPIMSCLLNLDSPGDGILDWTVGDRSKRTAGTMRISSNSYSFQLAEAYVRGTDLIVVYSETEHQPFRTEVYWRFDSDDDYFGIQLIVSVQTSRLETNASLTVESKLSNKAKSVEEGVVITSISDADCCYAEIVDGANLERNVIENGTSTNHLFPGFLEKGVIRRARMLGCFLNASASDETAKRVHHQFVESALPLTT